MQMKCPSGATGDDWVIPRPSPSEIAIYESIKRDSLPLLRAVGIRRQSKEHKELTTIIQMLHRQYLHPFKYVEEQAPDRVDQLIAKAQLSLPWLNKYEAAWPARIYLKRYVDGRRPHYKVTRHARQKQRRVQKSQPTSNHDSEDPGPGDIWKDHDLTVREFLSSLTPSLKHHLNAFVELGIRDQETLQAFLSWPQVVQAQFLDEGHAVLRLTSLEKKALLVGCGLVVQKTLQEPLVRIVKPGYSRP